MRLIRQRIGRDETLFEPARMRARDFPSRQGSSRQNVDARIARAIAVGRFVPSRTFATMKSILEAARFACIGRLCLRRSRSVPRRCRKHSPCLGVRNRPPRFATPHRPRPAWPASSPSYDGPRGASAPATRGRVQRGCADQAALGPIIKRLSDPEPGGACATPWRRSKTEAEGPQEATRGKLDVIAEGLPGAIYNSPFQVHPRQPAGKASRSSSSSTTTAATANARSTIWTEAPEGPSKDLKRGAEAISRCSGRDSVRGRDQVASRGAHDQLQGRQVLAVSITSCSRRTARSARRRPSTVAKDHRRRHGPGREATSAKPDVKARQSKGQNMQLAKMPCRLTGTPSYILVGRRRAWWGRSATTSSRAKVDNVRPVRQGSECS